MDLAEGSVRPEQEVKKSTGFYPRLGVDTSRVSAVGQAGGVLLTETIRVSGLGLELSVALERWRKSTAVHDPAQQNTDPWLAPVERRRTRRPGVLGGASAANALRTVPRASPRQRLRRYNHNQHSAQESPGLERGLLRHSGIGMKSR